MGDFPAPGVLGFNPRGSVSPHHAETPLGQAQMVGRQVAASAVWLAANTAVFLPIFVEEPTTIARLWWFNGTVVSGNVDIGVYRGTARQVSSGSTAQAGTSNIQQVDTADVTILPGDDWYLAMAMDNITGTVWRFNTATVTARMCGVRIMASAFPLPATATFATPGTAYYPVMGGSTRSAVL